MSQGSRVQYPVWQHTFVSLSAFSRRAVVSYWRKYVHEVLVNRLGGLSLPRKSVVRLTDRPDMTLDVYCGRKTTIQQQQQLNHFIIIFFLNGSYYTHGIHSISWIYKVCLYICLSVHLSIRSSVCSSICQLFDQTFALNVFDCLYFCNHI